MECEALMFASSEYCGTGQTAKHDMVFSPWMPPASKRLSNRDVSGKFLYDSSKFNQSLPLNDEKTQPKRCILHGQR